MIIGIIVVIAMVSVAIVLYKKDKAKVTAAVQSDVVQPAVTTVEADVKAVETKVETVDSGVKTEVAALVTDVEKKL